MTYSSTVKDIIDDQGFVTDPDLWDRDLALAMAAQLGIDELSEIHWQVIDEIRAHYLEHGSLPWMGHVCRSLDLEDNCFYRLFHGPLEAWKIAGLPDPGSEARIYMENEEPE
jgi:tRNA 2-thiouridine synthesizing protein E